MFDAQSLLVKSGCDAVLLISHENTFYAANYESTFAYVLITAERTYYLTDARYTQEARKCIEGMEIKECSPSDLYNIINSLISGLRTLAYDEDISLREYRELVNGIVGVELVPLGERCKDMRKVKSGREIDNIVKAQHIAEKAFEKLLGFVKEGVTERECAYTLEYYMKKYGGEAISFDTIVAFGENTACPHAHPSLRKLKKGDFITCDFGTVIGGYHGDMTRTFAFGKPTHKMIEVYKIVHKANLMAIDSIRAGVKASDVDAVARNFIADAGYGECFGHGLGHGVGVEIHEEPRLSPSCHDILEVNNVVTVEPGIYIDNEFGVRIEDIVIVEENGVRDINTLTKELIIL